MDNGSGPVTGLVVALVTDLDDPQRLGRVKLSYPDLGGVASDWVRVVAPFAGRNRGAVLRPEVGDEVVVGFERGDMRAPYVLGGVWSTADPPPAGDGDQKANNWRFLTSRSGHVILLDDTDGAERIKLVDKDGARTVLLDSANRKVTVECSDGDVEVTATSGTVRVTGSTVDIHATSQLVLRSDGGVRINGRSIDLN